MMAYIMPLFALTGLYWQFGQVIYWVTTNVWTLGQQYVLLRKYPVGAAALAADGNQPTAGGGAKPATAMGFTSLRKSGAGGAGKADQTPRGGDGAKNAQPGRPNLSKSASANSGSGGSANGHKPASADGGVLRRFGKGRGEAETPAPAEPEARIVRQQRQRQSRSKRTGKR